MNETPNYQLSQWEKDDRILMEDFNGDNAKLEAALTSQQTALQDAQAALQSSIQTVQSSLQTSIQAVQTSLQTSIQGVQNYAQSSVAALNAAVALRGNCQIAYITYTGTGVASKTLTFSQKPLAIFLCSDCNFQCMAVRGLPQARLMPKTDATFINFQWGDRTVTWYADNSTIAMNQSPYTYFAVVLLEM